MNDWHEVESPKMRETVELAKRVSMDGDYTVLEIVYGHKCVELGRGECCIEAGSQILINPAFWQQIEATAKAMGTTVSELWDVPEDWNQDDDIKLSKKWKQPR